MIISELNHLSFLYLENILIFVGRILVFIDFQAIYHLYSNNIYGYYLNKNIPDE
jgi:hypothetical protein